MLRIAFFWGCIVKGFGFGCFYFYEAVPAIVDVCGRLNFIGNAYYDCLLVKPINGVGAANFAKRLPDSALSFASF